MRRGVCAWYGPSAALSAMLSGFLYFLQIQALLHVSVSACLGTCPATSPAHADKVFGQMISAEHWACMHCCSSPVCFTSAFRKQIKKKPDKPNEDSASSQK